MKIIWIGVVFVGFLSNCTIAPIKTAQDIIDKNTDYEDRLIEEQQRFEIGILNDKTLSKDIVKKIILYTQNQVLATVNHSRQNSRQVESLGKESNEIKMAAERITEDAEFGKWIKRISYGILSVIFITSLGYLYSKL